MASIVDTVHAYLMDDPTLVGTLGASGYSGILQGGVWTRPLKREGPAKTATAFYATEKGRHLRPSAVVVDDGDSEHVQRPWIPAAYEGYVLVYFYAPATQTGKEAIYAAESRAITLLDGWRFTSDSGAVAFVEYADRVGLLDSEEFIGAVFDYCRYRIVSRHHQGV